MKEMMMTALLVTMVVAQANAQVKKPSDRMTPEANKKVTETTAKDVQQRTSKPAVENDITKRFESNPEFKAQLKETKKNKAVADLMTEVMKDKSDPTLNKISLDLLQTIDREPLTREQANELLEKTPGELDRQAYDSLVDVMIMAHQAKASGDAPTAEKAMFLVVESVKAYNSNGKDRATASKTGLEAYNAKYKTNLTAKDLFEICKELLKAA